MNTNNIQQGTVARTDAFGSSELAVSADVQSAALMAQAEAEVKARWAIAQRNPRNYDSVRVALLRECERPGFAEVAKYSKPVGKERVVGPSIRFVETALRCMTNIVASTTVVSEDRTTRRLQVMVTDLETNVSWPRQITLEKTVERKKSEGRIVVYERLNSYGERVYVVLATEDELANKEAAAVSKAIRTAGLRVIPGDLIEEALSKVDAVRVEKVKRDPAGERKKLVDAFVTVGVKPEQLVEYLGHALDVCAPAELNELRDIYAALRDGETRWAAVMESKRESDPVQAPPPPAKQAPAQVTPTETAPVESAAAAAAKPKPTPPPRATPPDQNLPTTLDDILNAIGSAQKRSDLNPLAGRINKLTSDGDRAVATGAYQAKAKELR